MDKDSRFKNWIVMTRCLDCESELTGIDYKVTDLVGTQRKMLASLLRKGYNDYQIYENMTMIYGRHSMLYSEIKDGSATSIDFGSVI